MVEQDQTRWCFELSDCPRKFFSNFEVAARCRIEGQILLAAHHVWKLWTWRKVVLACVVHSAAIRRAHWVHAQMLSVQIRQMRCGQLLE